MTSQIAPPYSETVAKYQETLDTLCDMEGGS